MVTLLVAAFGGPAAVGAPSPDDYWDSRFDSLSIDDSVRAIVTSGDLVFVGGWFQRIGGVSVSHVAEWDGGVWRPLGDGIQSASGYATIETMVWWQGRLYVGGFFDRAGTVQTKGIACWDGAQWAEVGGGVSGYLSSLATSRDYLYAAGNFVSAGGVVVHHVARWDGQHWEGLGQGVTGDGAGVVAVHRDEVYISGRDDTVAGSWIGRWNGQEFPLIGTARYGSVHCLQSTSFGMLAAGGSRTISGVSNSVALWDGANWLPIGAQLTDYGYANAVVEVQRRLFVGGMFKSAGGLTTSNIVSSDGAAWSALGSGAAKGRLTSVSCLASRPGELLVGGGTLVDGLQAGGFSIYHLPRTLVGRRSGEEVVVSWPKADTNLVLEVTTRLDPPDWQLVPTPPVIANNRLTVTNTLAPGAAFYRLREP